METPTLFPGLSFYAFLYWKQTFKRLLDAPFRLTTISYWVLLQRLGKHNKDREENDISNRSECIVTHLKLSCGPRILPSVSAINNLIYELRNENKLE
jgi:hypothetical protein